MQQCRIAGAMLVVILACGIVWGQDTKKPGAATPNKVQAVKEAVGEKLTGRLPNGFGKIGITDVQKQKIYGIQAKYADQIEALTKQLDELKSKRDAEIEGVLTTEQKEKLKDLQKAAADKKAAAKTEESK